MEQTQQIRDWLPKAEKLAKSLSKKLVHNEGADRPKGAQWTRRLVNGCDLLDVSASAKPRSQTLQDG